MKIITTETDNNVIKSSVFLLFIKQWLESKLRSFVFAQGKKCSDDDKTNSC